MRSEIEIELEFSTGDQGWKVLKSESEDLHSTYCFPQLKVKTLSRYINLNDTPMVASVSSEQTEPGAGCPFLNLRSNASHPSSQS